VGDGGYPSLKESPIKVRYRSGRRVPGGMSEAGAPHSCRVGLERGAGEEADYRLFRQLSGARLTREPDRSEKAEASRYGLSLSSGHPPGGQAGAVRAVPLPLFGLVRAPRQGAAPF
jgi:hypothetical protein